MGPWVSLLSQLGNCARKFLHTNSPMTKFSLNSALLPVVQAKSKNSTGWELDIGLATFLKYISKADHGNHPYPLPLTPHPFCELGNAPRSPVPLTLSRSLFVSFSLTGILSWNIDLSSIDLNQQLRLFITRHLAHFSSEVKG